MRIYDATYLGIEKKEQLEKKKFVSSKDFDLEQFEADMGWKSTKKASEPIKQLADTRKEVNLLDKILKKSVIKSDFERLHSVPPYELSKQLEMHKRREKRKMGTGAGWFNMHAPEITPEIRYDLEIIRMRSVLNPKRFYKKNDIKALPKHFHIGKVVDSPMDFTPRVSRKKNARRQSLTSLWQMQNLSSITNGNIRRLLKRSKKRITKLINTREDLKERRRNNRYHYIIYLRNNKLLKFMLCFSSFSIKKQTREWN